MSASNVGGGGHGPARQPANDAAQGDKAPRAPVFAVAKHRLEALSDGVYAIALTLLVLELKLPALPHDVSEAALRAALVDLLPKVLAWILSFCVIALIWVAQQRLYRLAERLDRRMGRIELLMLALISLLPFSTALVGEYGSHVTASAVYAGHLVAIALVGLLRVQHFLAHPEMQAPNIDAQSVHGMRLRSRIFLACTGGTLVLALFLPGYNMLAMLPAALAPFIARE
jgi:uncharacterized membrane protein